MDESIKKIDKDEKDVDTHKQKMLKSLVICSIIVALSFAVFLYYVLLFFEENQKKGNLENSVTSQISKNKNALNSINTINAYSKDFKREIDLGTIGFANRLQWTDAIKTSAKHLNIIDIAFILKETNALEDLEHPLYQDDVNISVIEMEVNLGTRHEGLIYSFFEQLKQRARGRFTIEECLINRAITTQNINAAAFQTSCTLHWFIIENPLEPNNTVASTDS